MFGKTLLALAITFIAALAAAGPLFPHIADAWDGYYYDFPPWYYAYPVSYGVYYPGVPYYPGYGPPYYPGYGPPYYHGYGPPYVP